MIHLRYRGHSRWGGDFLSPVSSTQRKQRKVQNTPRKKNKTCSNLTQDTQEVANHMALICHVIRYGAVFPSPACTIFVQTVVCPLETPSTAPRIGPCRERTLRPLRPRVDDDDDTLRTLRETLRETLRCMYCLLCLRRLRCVRLETALYYFQSINIRLMRGMSKRRPTHV